MREYDLQKLIDNPLLVENKIKQLMNKQVLFRQNIDMFEIEGHILKSENNLRFVKYILKSMSSA